MGISGLIPFLEKASSKVNLRDIRGSTCAVDTYCWLHKGAFACAEKLVRGEETDQYIHYCLRYVQLLLSHDIKPILVFDGRHLPAKALTETRRRESRQESRRRARELLRVGQVDDARSHMRRCVDVTHQMALRLIQECRLRNVDCIVAPYEADAQLAWLDKAGLAQYIITEDSDLTLFGARRVLFKLDLSGSALLVEADKLHLAMGCRQEQYTFDKFRRMCILSGCDYLDSLPGIGLSTACKFILKTEEDDVDMWRVLKKMPRYLNRNSLEVDDEYIESFLKAEATFKHMYIYNPLERCMERLHALTEFETDERYCCNAGVPLEDTEQAFHLALGNLDPFTLKQLDNWHPDRDLQRTCAQAAAKRIKRSKYRSIWQRDFKTQHSLDKKQPHGQRSAGCALFFKKVDFISKTIDMDISENMRLESAKPEEADVFSIYSNEVDVELEVPAAKRKRSSNDQQDHDANSAKIAHNPFAKVHRRTTMETEETRAVCENGSLLKVLSPKKCALAAVVDTQARSGRLSMKRCTLSTGSSTANHAAQVEVVKSRFFASNLSEIAKRHSPTPDVSDEIVEIEKRFQDVRKQQALLYKSPSPKKQSSAAFSAETALYQADSGIELTANNNAIDDATQQTLAESATTTTNTATEIIVGDINSKDAVIVLSDDNYSDCERAIGADSTNSFGIGNKESNNRAPKPPTTLRLGLAKPKRKMRGSKVQATKAVNATTRTSSQTKLSMFGFQKAPVLK